MSKVPAAHAAFLERALAVLRDEPRILGLAAGGSWVTGGFDEHSDLDLVVLVEPSAHAAMVAGSKALAETLGPVLTSFTGEHVGVPELLIALYGPPLLHVDLKFVRPEDLRKRIEDPEVLWERDGAMTDILKASKPTPPPPPDLQWMEDRFWGWIHYVATKIGRGEYLEAVSGLDFLRNVVLGPLAGSARGVRRLEERGNAELLHATLATPDRTSLAASTRAAAALYRSLAKGDHVRRTDAERETLRFLDEVCR